MKITRKYAALVGLASVLAWAVGSTGLAVDRSLLTAPKPVSGLNLVRQAAGKKEVTVLLSTRQGQAGSVARTVKQMGGAVKTILSDADFLVARVPASALQELERNKQVRAMALDRRVQLDKTAMKPLDGKAQAVPSASDPALSLKVTRGEIRASQFAEETGADGTGTLVAILDTGVDPIHPALQKTAGGETKIVDWQDFTGEGDIETKEQRTEPIRGIVSLGGVYKLGVFKESQIPKGEMESDINRNGKDDDQFAVLLTDAHEKGVYDTAYVDINGNGDFTDEQPLGEYSKTQQAGIFGPKEIGVGFAVTRITPSGAGLNIGYDGGQHGTHVAGITAGTGPMTGIAPGAKIMAIKVLTSGGSGDWNGIIQGMHYAATHGAHVINMSLGGMTELNDGSDPQSIFINDLTKKTGTVFSIAAGNSGPGLNSVGLPAVAAGAITSGAYISQNTWKVDYGLKVPQEGLWYFSSAGPRDDGALKPNIVAPGTANSSVPAWSGAEYAVFQGTSMATPQTSGAAALLVGAAKTAGIQYTSANIKTALELGARRLPGYGWYEQGHGLIQVDNAWKLLPRLAKEITTDLVSFGRAKPGTAGTGLYAREFAVRGQDARWLLGNRDFKRTQLALSYLPGNGLTLSGPVNVAVPAIQKREIPLRFDYAAGTPGVYDALVQARIPSQIGYASEFLATVVVSHEFDPSKGNIINGLSGSLGPARYARHFVRVPAGTTELTINMNVPGNQGRVRVMAYTPDGMPAGASPYAGAPKGPEKQTLTVANPAAGVWEIDAYASHGSLDFGIAENQYVIDVAARGVYAAPARIDLQPSPGQIANRKVRFANYYDEIKSVTAGVGFVQPKSERMEVEHGNLKDMFFDVTEGTAILRVGFGAVNDPTAQLEIGLFYQDPAQGWMAVGQSIGSQVTVLAPAPGKYAAEIVGKTVPAGKTAFSYYQAQVKGGESVSVQDNPASRTFGERWTVPVSIKMPSGFGIYLGAVTLTDEKTGKLLTVVPIEVK